MYRNPQPAPASRVPAERRGAEVGRFCLACGNVYPKFRARHAGKPLHGKDHVASPCQHEGERFAAGEPWWEPAVEVRAAARPVEAG